MGVSVLIIHIRQTRCFKKSDSIVHFKVWSYELLFILYELVMRPRLTFGKTVGFKITR